MKLIFTCSLGLICSLSPIGSAANSEPPSLNRIITDVHGRKLDVIILRRNSEKIFTFKRKSDGREFTMNLDLVSLDDQSAIKTSFPIEIEIATEIKNKPLNSFDNAAKPPADCAIDRNPRGAGQFLGQIAPDFYFTTLDGKTFKLSELRGSNVIIMTFLISKNGPMACNGDPEIWNNMPTRLKLAKERNVKVIFVNTWSDENSGQGMGDFLRKQNLELTGFAEFYPNFDKIWGFPGNPNVGIIDKNGNVAHDHASIISTLQYKNINEKNYSLKALDAALMIINTLE